MATHFKNVSVGASVAAGALILLIPAMIAGRPFVFWDTPFFYAWGHDILAAIRHPWPPLAQFPAHRGLWAAIDVPDGWERVTAQQFQLVLSFIGARSKFYAVPLYALSSTLGLWAPAVVQALLVSWMIWTTAGAVLPRQSPRAALTPVHLGLIGVLTVATTAPFYAAFLMPDVFAPLGVLATVLLLCFPDCLTRPERVGCAVLIVVAALVHMANFAVLIALLAIALAAWRPLSPPLSAWRGTRIVLAALLGAAAIGFVSDAGIRALFGEPVRTAPFLEGRVIADGPGQLFLRETCATRHWVACRYKDSRVPEPDYIIWPFGPKWESLPRITDPAERNRFLDEEIPIVIGTLTHHPLAELRAALANAAHSFLDFRIGDSVGASLIGMLSANEGLNRWVLRTVPNIGPCIASLQACNGEPLLRRLQTFQFYVVVMAFASLVLRLAWWYAVAGSVDEERRRLAVFVLSLIGTVAANAAICGATSGPFERYQARMIWLVPMLAAMIEIREAKIRTRARSVPPVGQVLLGAGEDRSEAIRRPLP